MGKRTAMGFESVLMTNEPSLRTMLDMIGYL